MKLRLSSKDILNKKFKQSANGYDPEEVDTFLDKILEDYRTIDKEIDGLNAEIISLKRDNETLKANLRDKEQAISIQKSKNIQNLTNSLKVFSSTSKFILAKPIFRYSKYFILYFGSYKFA